MAVLNRAEARRRRAGAHARHVRCCPLCGKECRGNGAWSSHRRMHLRQHGRPDTGNVRADFRQLRRDLAAKGD